MQRYCGAHALRATYMYNVDHYLLPAYTSNKKISSYTYTGSNLTRRIFTKFFALAKK